MGRRGFDEESTEWEDDGFDAELRSEFARAIPGEADSVRVLDDLRPSLVRARRMHQVKQAALGVAVSMLLLGGIGLAVRQLSDRTEEGLTFAGEPETQPQPDRGGPLQVTGTTIGDPLPVDGGRAGDVADEAAGSDTAPVAEASALPASTPSPTTTTGPTTTNASTTVPASTAGASPPTTEVNSSCGSIIIAVSGTTIDLVESRPAPRYRADEKSTGPQTIEVSFEGGSKHCELKAEIRNGRLVIRNED